MSRAPLAVIFGTPGTVLTDDQRAFFRETDPLGLILFKRNCEAPDQVRRLCEDFREAVGRQDAPILIDHEGGTHQRMDPPVWPAFPAPATGTSSSGAQSTVTPCCHSSVPIARPFSRAAAKARAGSRA